MSFKTILEKRGRPVKLIKVARENKSGYIKKSEEEIWIFALVFPLTSKELEFWLNAGVEKAKLKAYVEARIDVKTGDYIEIDGTRYLIRAYENWSPYHKKLILEA
ncbi:MAG: hypothetical protein QXV61_00150 [Archaeoglobaceae archaeon]